MSIPSPTSLVFEHHHNGLGLQSATPRVSWRFRVSDDAVPSWIQTAYDIEVQFGNDPRTRVTLHVESQQSVLVPWPVRPLVSRESARVRVRVYGEAPGQSPDTSKRPSAWSDESSVEAALLDESDFEASFITSASRTESADPLRPIRFKKIFSLPTDLIASSSALRGRLYITSLGLFKVWINGTLASDEFMAPGWTSYRHRLVYRILDVSSLLLPEGSNAICVEVGEGWYAGRLGFGGGKRFRYGEELALFAQLEVLGGDASGASSSPFKLLTDDAWLAMPSAIVSSEIYDGEVFDCGSEIDDWTLASTDWPAAQTFATRIVTKPSARLIAPDAAPVRTTERVTCKQVLKSRAGKTILDFGQNLVGKLFIPKLELREGDTLVLQHAEVLEDGELGTRPLRIAKCTDTVIGATGKKLIDWSPSFTFHGFRYVQVDGWPGGQSSAQDICALVTHTDMRRRGFFECSNSVVNQLHSNVVWSMRGNFLSIPTDCPQRDERLGWTGDLQAFCRTAAFLYDPLGMLGNWLEDVAAEQMEPEANGVIPLVVPEAMPPQWHREANSQAIWGDVAVLAPNDLYQYSGDVDLLERQFDSMRAWLDRGVARAPDGLWDSHKFQLADWLDPNSPPDDPAQSSTTSDLVANAYLVHVTQVFAGLCSALGKEDLASRYREDGARLLQLFQRRYITPDGNLVSLSQTGISLAIQFGLYRDDAPARELASDTLERLVRKAKFKISTGFAGTPVVTHALTSIGRPQLAYGMLLQTECPGWLYPVVKHNATTIWERWDSMLGDGRINPGEMTSFNHYALGAVADWLHSSVAGISPQNPGWKVVRVRPVPGGNLTWAKASFEGPYGLVACQWELEGNTFKLTLTIPPNCSAIVTLPSELATGYMTQQEKTRTVGSGTHYFSCEYRVGEWPPHAIGHHFTADGNRPNVPFADDRSLEIVS
jgi:alpha-L-rhamnosidase